MGGQIVKSVRSRPRSNGARRSVVVTCACLLCVSAVAAAFLAGCGGNQAVKTYVTEGNEILTEINAKAAKLKKLWGVPMADQGDMQKALADYRKSLADAQDKLDKVSMPEQCVKLDDLLRQAVNDGRELADLSTPYADYLDDAAPCANLAASIVSELRALQNENDVASGLAGLADKAQQLETDVRTINTPSVFVGMNQVFDNFAQGMLGSLERAAGQADSQQTEGQTSEGSQTSRRQQNSDVVPSLRSLPQNWALFNGQLSAMLDTVRDVSGLKAKNAEVEALIGQALAEIQSLKKKFK